MNNNILEIKKINKNFKHRNGLIEIFKNVTLKMYDKITLIDSMFSENKTPIIIPKTLAISPIVKPVKKKDFIIELLLRPSVFKIAISLVLFLIKIVSPEIILKAATIMINVRIINITFLSTLRALKNDLFKSIQL